MSGQVLTVKLSRGDGTSWGFRLSGGKDFSCPLTVQRVNPNSLAEQGGLQTGDCILTIGGRNADDMRHKEAQDAIVTSGNYLDLSVQRGGTRIWKPSVTPVGNRPSPGALRGDPTPMTKTSLAANKQSSQPIGSGHNTSARPFANNSIPSVVHNQYNSPANLYSMENIAEALSAQTEVLATGAVGINFMKEDKPVNTGSAVYQLVHGQDHDHGSKGDDSHLFRGESPINTQSNAFRRLQSSLDAPVTPPVVVTRKVEAPIQKPPSLKPTGDAAGGNVCTECGRVIIGVFVRVKDKSLHAECFRCSTCGTSLKNVGYYNVNDKLYCDIHAKQAASMIGPTTMEPLTISPGSAIPYDTPIMGVGPSPPMAGPRSPGTNFSNVSPVPFHHGGENNNLLKIADPPCNGNHIEPVKAPISPVTSPSAIFGTSAHLHPQTAPPCDAHRPIHGGAKFTWPPPKGPEQPTFESNASPSIPTYRPPPGTQHYSPTGQPSQPSFPQNVAPTGPTTPLSLNTSGAMSPGGAFSGPKTPPAVAPKPFKTSPVTSSSTPTPTWTSPQPANLPPGGLNPNPGSRPAPRRGRGQLKQQAGPGTRIPICSVCGTPIRGPFIVALGKTWCPDHFVCKNNQCRRPLADVGFVEEQGQLYCEGCWENYLAPTCCKCHIRIKGDCLNALDKQWHPDCFVCSYCHKPFGNSSFYLEDGKPYCEKDWNELFTTKCVGCGFPIEAGDRWVEALNNNYHSQCFKCTICQKNLEGQSFYAKGGRPFCKAHAR